MARPHTTHFIPYEDACRIVQSNNIRNRDHYWRWHRATHPDYLPRHPHRVYDQWTSWNDFLGNLNSFEKTLARKKNEKIVHRTYWEAVRYAQQMAKDNNLVCRKDWERFYDEYELPRDIPKRPHQVYEGFSWNVWLGKTLEGKIKTARESVAIFVIHHKSGEAQNVIVPLVHKNGYHSMINRVKEGKIGRPYKMFKWEVELSGSVDQMLAHHGHKQGDGSYIIPNMNALLWDLTTTLEIFVGQ